VSCKKLFNRYAAHDEVNPTKNGVRQRILRGEISCVFPWFRKSKFLTEEGALLTSNQLKSEYPSHVSQIIVYSSRNMTSSNAQDVNMSRITARVTPQLLAKVSELLLPEDKRLTPAEKAALQADLDSSKSVRAELTRMDSEEEDTEAHTGPVLHYDSLRIVCRFSLFSLKDLLKEGKIASEGLEDSVLSAAAATPSEELRNRREYLLKRQEEKAYNRMVHNSDTTPEVDAKQARTNTMGTAVNSASVGTNMIVTSLACFAVSYFVGQQMQLSRSACLTWGLGGAVVMLVVEMVLYVARATKLERVAVRPSGKLRGGLGSASIRGSGGPSPKRDLPASATAGTGAEVGQDEQHKHPASSGEGGRKAPLLKKTD